MNGLKELRELALQASRWKHPTMPEKWRCTHNYSDRTANGLQKCIIDWCNFNGFLAERTGCTGRYIDQSKTITDTLGFTKRIGTGRWIPTSGTKGTSDLHLIINGISIACEIKMKDRQSPDQKAYQAQVEKSGGLYWLVRSFDEFLNFYNELINGKDRMF